MEEEEYLKEDPTLDADVKNYISGKFGETKQEEESFENPMLAGNQIETVKAAHKKANPSVGLKFRRLLAGKGFQ